MTAYEVILHPHAKRELERLLSADFRRIDDAILALSQIPRPKGVKKLWGHFHRIRVGEWRVIFAIQDKERRISVMRIARRSKKTYKGLRESKL